METEDWRLGGDWSAMETHATSQEVELETASQRAEHHARQISLAPPVRFRSATWQSNVARTVLTQPCLGSMKAAATPCDACQRWLI